jgi:hypothetical protein
VITDAEALAALPQSGWLRSYVEHAYGQTTAPLAYHIGFGLVCLAATAPLDLAVDYIGHLHGNFYTMAVGRSGDDQKSSALRVAREVLWQVDSTLIGRSPGSWEGLIDSLGERPRQTIFYSEFGDFLSKANNPGYFGPMKTSYTDLWDCLDHETEVLTPAGWRGMGAVGALDAVLTLDRTAQRVAWQRPTAQRVRALAPGERMVTFNNGIIDIRVTEGHTIYFARGQAPRNEDGAVELEAATAGEMVEHRGTVRLPLAGLPAQVAADCPGAPVPSRVDLRLWGLHVLGQRATAPLTARPVTPAVLRAELKRARAAGRLLGWALISGAVAPEAPHLLRLGELRPARVEAALQLCRTLRLGLASAPEEKGPRTLHIRLDKTGLGALLASLLDPETRFGALASLPLEAIDAVIEGVKEAAQVADRYAAMPADLAADLAAAGAVHGRHSSTLSRPVRRQRAGDDFSPGEAARVWFHFSGKEAVSTVLGRAPGPAFAFEEPLPGERVWCVTVPSGALVVRRRGRVFIVGNCTPQSRVKAKGRNNEGGNTDVPNPRLSLACACSLSYLMSHTSKVDWEGGFLGRFFFLHSRRERTDPWPVGNPGQAKVLAQALTTRATLANAGPWQGLTPEARAFWHDWFYELEGSTLPEAISGAKTRIPAMAIKIALLLSWDFGGASSGAPWYTTLQEIAWATQLVRLHLRSLVSLAEQVVEHPAARLRRDILDFIPVGGARSFGECITRLKIPYKQVKDILDGLTYEGFLSPGSGNVPGLIQQPGQLYFHRQR